MAKTVDMRKGGHVILVRFELCSLGKFDEKKEIGYIKIFYHRGEKKYEVHATELDFYGGQPNYIAHVDHRPGEKGGLFWLLHKCMNALAERKRIRVEQKRKKPPGLSLKKAEALQKKAKAKKKGDDGADVSDDG